MNDPEVQIHLEPPRAEPSRLLSGVGRGLIWVYRTFVSAPLHFAAGPGAGCRFHPTCSAYATEALRVHGPIMGLFLTVRRLLRCMPWRPGGVDFVPARRPLRRRCDRALPARRTA